LFRQKAEACKHAADLGEREAELGAHEAEVGKRAESARLKAESECGTIAYLKASEDRKRNDNDNSGYNNQTISIVTKLCGSLV
jgi:hypothetical protein